MHDNESMAKVAEALELPVVHSHAVSETCDRGKFGDVQLRMNEQERLLAQMREFAEQRAKTSSTRGVR